MSVSRDVVDHEDLVDTGVPTSAQFETTHVETPLRAGAQGPAATPRFCFGGQPEPADRALSSQ